MTTVCDLVAPCKLQESLDGLASKGRHLDGQPFVEMWGRHHLHHSPCKATRPAGFPASSVLYSIVSGIILDIYERLLGAA